MKKILLSGAVFIFFFYSSMGQNIPTYMPSNGLQAWWPFNGNANDETGNNNNGTVNGATLANDRNNNANSAYSFDGASNSITIPDNDSLSFFNNQFTFSFWMNWNANANQELAILGKRGTQTSNFEYYIGKFSPTSTNPNCIMPHTWNLGGTNVYQFPNLQPNTTTAGVWEHYVITADSTISKVYKNGTLLYSSLSPTILMGNSAGNLTIGSGGGWGTTRWMDGMLDDIAIWNRALTPCEITKLFLESDVIVAQPQDTSGVVNGSAYFSILGAAGANYQWQGNFGAGFNDLNNNTQYAGVTSDTLHITNLSINDNNNKYRCILTLGGCINITDTVSLSIIDNSGIEKLQTESGFSIYPNPAQNNTTLIVKDQFLNMPYTIFNSVGQAIMQGKIVSKTTNIDLITLPEGIYTVHIFGTLAKKIIIRK